MAKLLGYDFEIQYKPGASSKVANALSRVLLPAELHQLVGIQWLDWEALQREIDNDEFLTKLKVELQ